jgi:hypothetical protein
VPNHQGYEKEVKENRYVPSVLLLSAIRRITLNIKAQDSPISEHRRPWPASWAKHTGGSGELMDIATMIIKRENLFVL